MVVAQIARNVVMVFLKIEIFITTLQILTFWREPKFKLFKKSNVKTLIYCRRKKSWYIKIIFIDLDSFTVIRWIKLYSSMINSEISFNIYVPVMQKNQIFTKTIWVAKKEIKRKRMRCFCWVFRSEEIPRLNEHKEMQTWTYIFHPKT